MSDDMKDLKRIIPPKVEDVARYCRERNNGVDAEQFCDFYECKGWYVGKNKMVDWQAAVRTWERSRVINAPKKKGGIW